MVEASDAGEPTQVLATVADVAGEKLMEGERGAQAEVEAVAQAPPTRLNWTLFLVWLVFVEFMDNYLQMRGMIIKQCLNFP
jgi:hypothetical protein